MRLPAVIGVIQRRVLVNYSVDQDVLQRVVPAPFRVKAVNGRGMAGICLIRLAGMRPRFVPPLFGLSSENAAHRIAVEWDAPDGIQEGVYVPRRDTSSRWNTLVGGRLFPGEHSRAVFDVRESHPDYSIALRSVDGETRMRVEASACEQLPSDSVFESVPAASAFFERGSLGYSATRAAGCFDGLELKSLSWRVQPLDVRCVESSFFEDAERFPGGSVCFDSALLMRDIQHEWHARGALSVTAPSAPTAD